MVLGEIASVSGVERASGDEQPRVSGMPDLADCLRGYKFRLGEALQRMIIRRR